MAPTPKQTPSATVIEPMLARAAKAAYDKFVKEAGFEHDARIREWGKLSYVHQSRWVAIVRAVLESLEASRGKDQRGGESRVQRDVQRPRGLRPRDDKAQTQKPANRNRGARRR
jgi:hypothetical protein